MRVSITGYGYLCADGWRTDTVTGLPVYAIDDGELSDNLDERMRSLIRRVRPDRSGRLGLVAAARAVAQAGWDGADFAILVGSSRGPTGSWESAFGSYASGEALPPSTSPRTTLGSPAFLLAEYFGTSTIAGGLSVTCSSGFHALLQGVALLRAGMAERVLVGGVEAPLTPFTLRQMEAMGVYAAGECRPLQRPATGMAVGEGAAFLALEMRRHRIGDILGLGFAREAGQGLAGISSGGDALYAAMTAALGQSYSYPGLLVPHAPGTAKGDAAELLAIERAFDGELPEIKSFKSTTGHTFGASGPLALAQALEKHRGETIMVNATGFGGNTVSVIVETR